MFKKLWDTLRGYFSGAGARGSSKFRSMAGVISREATESFPPSSHERIKACLKNLFDLPTKNIESAFELILGLVQEQSSKIDDLNRAHVEAVEKNVKIRASMQNAVDGLVRENDELSINLRTLKEEHATMSCTLDKLRQEIEVSVVMECPLPTRLTSLTYGDIPKMTYNLLGDVEGEPDSREAENSASKTQDIVVVDNFEINHSCRGVEVKDTNKGTKNVSGVNVGASPGAVEQSKNEGVTHIKEARPLDDLVKRSLGGVVGCIGLTKVPAVRRSSMFEISPNAERTVAARLHQLEQSLSSFMEKTSSKGQGDGKPVETKDDEALVDVKRRISSIETYLRGFEQDQKNAVATVEEELQRLCEAVEEKESALTASEGIKGEGPAMSLREENNFHQDKPRGNVDATLMRVLPQGQNDTTQLCRNVGNTERMTIGDLAHQISALRESIQERKVAPPIDVAAEKLGADYDMGAIERQVLDLGDKLQKQISELAKSVGDKVSNRELEIRIQEIRNFIASSLTSTLGTVAYDTEQKIMQQISKLESNMIDSDSYKQQLEHLKSDMNSLVDREISKLRFDISTNAERAEHGLTDIRSVIESQRHELTSLRNDIPTPANGLSIKEEYVNARIQEATDALRVSLDDRIDNMRLIENEIEGFASKLAEKPSQEQIDSMLQHLEKRLGHDVELQGIMENMKLGK